MTAIKDKNQFEKDILKKELAFSLNKWTPLPSEVLCETISGLKEWIKVLSETKKSLHWKSKSLVPRPIFEVVPYNLRSMENFIDKVYKNDWQTIAT